MNEGGKKFVPRRDRVIVLRGKIDEAQWKSVTSRLLVLEAEDEREPIQVQVDSPGGSVDFGFAIVDLFVFVKCPVSTYATNQAHAMACLIVARGTRGYRFANSDAIFSIIAGTPQRRSKVEDAEIERANLNMAKLLFAATGQKLVDVQCDMRAQRRFSALEALDYGIIDHLVE